MKAWLGRNAASLITLAADLYFLNVVDSFEASMRFEIAMPVVFCSWRETNGDYHTEQSQVLQTDAAFVTRRGVQVVEFTSQRNSTHGKKVINTNTHFR